MMIKEKINAVEQDPNVFRMLEKFFVHAESLQPKERERMINLLEYLLLPHYLTQGTAPIEEEWLNKEIQKATKKEE